MPEGRQRFELGYGPPGGLPGGHNPKLQVDPQDSYITRMSVNDLYEKQINAPTGKTLIENTVTQSGMISIFESHRTMCRKGMRERPVLVTNLKQSRTRLPANKQIKTRDLRHGCQGSLTIHAPIMEE